jgi:hypothetical protein
MIPSDAAKERPHKRASRSRSRERARLSGDFQRKHAMTTWRWVKIGVVMDPMQWVALSIELSLLKGGDNFDPYKTFPTELQNRKNQSKLM